MPESWVSSDPSEVVGFQELRIQANVAVQALRKHGVEFRVDKAEPKKVSVGQLYARDDKVRGCSSCLSARAVGLTHMVAHRDDKLLDIDELARSALA